MFFLLFCTPESNFLSKNCYPEDCTHVPEITLLSASGANNISEACKLYEQYKCGVHYIIDLNGNFIELIKPTDIAYCIGVEKFKSIKNSSVFSVAFLMPGYGAISNTDDNERWYTFIEPTKLQITAFLYFLHQNNISDNFYFYSTIKIPHNNLIHTAPGPYVSAKLYDMDDYNRRLSQQEDLLGYSNYLSSKSISFLRSSILSILNKHFEMTITDSDLSLVLLKFTLQYFSDLYFQYIEPEKTLSDKLSLLTAKEELLIKIACRLHFWKQVSPDFHKIQSLEEKFIEQLNFENIPYIDVHN